MSIPNNSGVNPPLPDNNNISIDKEGANRAATIGDLETLIFLSSLKPPIYPDQEGANKAAENGQLVVLRWLEKLESPILANPEDVDLRNIGLLRWFDITKLLERQAFDTANK